MLRHRRAVLLAILTVSLALMLLDSHGSFRQFVAELRETWEDMRGGAAHP